jgi:glycosyltransferase involved in cell wall biosynthesis
MRRARGPTKVDFTCLTPVWAGDDPGHFTSAMDSLAASSVAPSELVICQDGPLPPSLEAAVAAAVRALGARLTINPGARGLHHNLNHAMRAVGTPYVARFDADDLNLPDRFAAQVAFAQAHPEVAAFGGDIIEFWPDGRARPKAMPRTHVAISRFARWRNPINHMTAFFRVKAFFDAGGYPDIPLKEDYGLWLAMLARGERLANLGQDLVRVRLSEGFHGRRAGLRNFRSEWALCRLKCETPGIGAPTAVMALAARSAVLAATGPTRLIYERVLRR